MIERNVEEYKLIRQEMINLKDCITKYIGYVFAGSGAMIYGLARVNRSTDLLVAVETGVAQSSYSAEVAFISSSFSLLISFVLLTLFYKFYSHNRFAGFCKLLNHERHNSSKDELPKQKHPQPATDELNDDCKGNGMAPPLFSWEITVGDLRWLESKPTSLGNIIDKIYISEPTKRVIIEKVGERIESNGKSPELDRNKGILGLVIIINTILLRNTQTDSWGFPPLVVCTFLFLVSGFHGVSIFTASQIGFFETQWLSLYLAGTSVIQIYLWWHMSGRLYSLMNGSATVYSFYWKFIPLRALFLNKQNPDILPGYISIEEHMYPQERNAIEEKSS